MKLRTLWLALALLLPASAAQGQHVIGPSGDYIVRTTGTTKVTYGDGWVRIEWANEPTPNPDPTPGPTPNPTPDPVPPTPPPAPTVTGKLFVTMVYDIKNESQEQATTRADLATSTEWSALNSNFNAYASDQAAIDQLHLRGSLAELPCLVIQELKPDARTAPVVKTIPAVKSRDEVIAAIKELRGVKAPRPM